MHLTGDPSSHTSCPDAASALCPGEASARVIADATPAPVTSMSVAAAAMTLLLTNIFLPSPQSFSDSLSRRTRYRKACTAAIRRQSDLVPAQAGPGARPLPRPHLTRCRCRVWLFGVSLCGTLKGSVVGGNVCRNKPGNLVNVCAQGPRSRGGPGGRDPDSPASGFPGQAGPGRSAVLADLPGVGAGEQGGQVAVTVPGPGIGELGGHQLVVGVPGHLPEHADRGVREVGAVQPGQRERVGRVGGVCVVDQQRVLVGGRDVDRLQPAVPAEPQALGPVRAEPDRRAVLQPDQPLLPGSRAWSAARTRRR